jgi:hypothetical protein
MDGHLPGQCAEWGSWIFPAVCPLGLLLQKPSVTEDQDKVLPLTLFETHPGCTPQSCTDLNPYLASVDPEDLPRFS